MQIVGGALDDELINLFIAGILTAGIMLATRCMSAAQVRHPPAEGKRAAMLLRVRVAPQLRMTEKACMQPARCCAPEPWQPAPSCAVEGSAAYGTVRPPTGGALAGR